MSRLVAGVGCKEFCPILRHVPRARNRVRDVILTWGWACGLWDVGCGMWNAGKKVESQLAVPILDAAGQLRLRHILPPYAHSHCILLNELAQDIQHARYATPLCAGTQRHAGEGAERTASKALELGLGFLDRDHIVWCELGGV